MQLKAPHGLFLFTLSLVTLYAETDKLQDALNALSSQNTPVYLDAEKFINKHGPEAEPALRKMFVDTRQPPLARLRAVKLLGDLRDGSSVGAMRQALFAGEESNAAVREEIIRSLAKLGSNDSLVDYINSSLGQHDSVNVRAALANGLQGYSDDKTKQALSKLLESNDPVAFDAALLTASKIYKPVAISDKNGHSKGRNIADMTTSLSVITVPTSGDRAIIQVLDSKKNSTNPQIRDKAAAFSSTLSKNYKLQ